MRILLSSCKKFRAVQRNIDMPVFEIQDRKHGELIVGYINPIKKKNPEESRWVFYPEKDSFFSSVEMMDISCLVTTCRIAHTGIDFIDDDI